MVNKNSACQGARFSATALLCAASTITSAKAIQLADLTLEELSNLPITSVSKRPERLSDAPASVFVITSEDIRRSGAASLPEVLRLAPNLHVGQRSASQYSIGARGHNNTDGNKMLVLIDGRTVYSPLFSGVFWDAQDVMLEDVERIEIISGPGGTLWGVNAVNGVINIITRAAKDTQGSLLVAGVGSTESSTGVRHGSTLGENGHFRVYGKYFDGRHSRREDDLPINDAWNRTQAGFRADWTHTDNRLTVQGDVYEGREGQAPPGTITLGTFRPLNTISISGFNLLSRLDHQLDGGSRLKVQAYYDHTERTVPGTFDDRLDVIDLQFEHALPATDTHTFIWGAEYRYGTDEVTSSDFIAFLPSKADQTWGSLFAQDKISLLDNLQLTLGARWETNGYTHPELLPSVRLAWKLHPNHLLWTAASRTVRAPSRIDRDFYYPTTAPYVIGGGPEFRSEVAKVFELGYRGQPSPATSLSITAFHTIYDHLRTLEATDPGVFPLFFANRMEGHTTGVEAWGSYQPTETWRLSAGVTTLHNRLQLHDNSFGLNGGISAEGNDPELSWNLRSTFNLSEQWELDGTVRHVSSLPEPAVPAYTVIDLRVAWKANPNLEVSVAGRNLFGSPHAEFHSAPTRSALGPGVYFKVLARF
ncbi:TonB-dependent siderophore receptor [Aquabacterium sp. CECT 9606]|uniref:TonB-dependent receptor plug domain-containing protein n=1 Tax=Aquabacterium sp. CECT 9606 TaxID=2845822 RepID=UPI001E4F6E00|nr:TonB-dependent receptor [Aquabacterium sp. CECT 9606]CAH0353516.1 Vitamin B12 transporter BtuB [Aquabacterium sp. CECT 9606]